MKSPPGGGIFASPKRASSGPARRNEARICAESSSSTASRSMRRPAEPDAVVGDPLDLDAELLEQRELGLGVADPRHVVDDDLLLGQQAGGEDRQGRVLVACGGDLAGERDPALDDELLHGTARLEGSEPPMAEPTRDDAWELLLRVDRVRLACASTRLRSRPRCGPTPGATARTRSAGRSPGLVHDLDYERYPDLETGHPRMRWRSSSGLGYPQDIIDAVAGHADYLGVPRETQMAKTLYAVDEMSGFVTACALVRPTGIEGMKPKSVRKKMKQPSFAAAVDRDQLQRAADELGVDRTSTSRSSSRRWPSVPTEWAW